MRRRNPKLAAGSILGLLLLVNTACIRKPVGPNYQTPPTPQVAPTDEWATELSRGAVAKAADDQLLSAWWGTLDDDILADLEERAVQSNLDLREAEARIRQARALRNIEATGLLPSVSVGGSGSLSRSSDAQGFNRVNDSYSAGFDASWEPDIFGGTRRAIEAAEADIEGAEEDLRDLLVTLTAEVALNYVDLRSYQSRLSIAEANEDAQEETYSLARARFESGLGTQLEAEQARTNLETTRATIPSLEAGLEQAKNRLAVLLGVKPGSLDEQLDASAPIPVTPAEIAVGVPADLLRRRPDIRGAERGVAAQTARVGVATADLYPRFQLFGSIGLESISIPDLFTVGGIASLIAGSVEHQVFNRKRLKEAVNVQDALLDQAIVQYDNAVLLALEDVENALVDFAKEQVRRESLREAAGAAERSVTLSRDLYVSGLRDFLDVLDAQRSLLNLQDLLAQSDALVTTNLIRLYKALGGGWDSTAAPSYSTIPSGAQQSGEDAETAQLRPERR